MNTLAMQGVECHPRSGFSGVLSAAQAEAQLGEQAAPGRAPPPTASPRCPQHTLPLLDLG